MARDDSENFRVRPGRSRNGGARINPRTQPFLKQVQIAVRKAGGDPRRIGAGARSGSAREGGRTGRFNARGRGAKVVASLVREGSDKGWQRDSAGRFSARRVVARSTTTTPAMPTPTSSSAGCSMTAGPSISLATISPTASATGPASWSPVNWVTRARSSFRQSCKTRSKPSA